MDECFRGCWFSIEFIALSLFKCLKYLMLFILLKTSINLSLIIKADTNNILICKQVSLSSLFKF